MAVEIGDDTAVVGKFVNRVVVRPECFGDEPGGVGVPVAGKGAFRQPPVEGVEVAAQGQQGRR